MRQNEFSGFWMMLKMKDLGYLVVLEEVEICIV